MKKKTGHTPTPWKMDKKTDDTHFYIRGADDRYVAQMTPMASIDPFGDANAAFIVRAVNAHEEMLVALKQAQATIHATWKSLHLAKDGDVAKVFQTVSQAIAKAEQE